MEARAKPKNKAKHIKNKKKISRKKQMDYFYIQHSHCFK